MKPDETQVKWSLSERRILGLLQNYYRYQCLKLLLLLKLMMRNMSTTVWCRFGPNFGSVPGSFFGLNTDPLRAPVLRGKSMECNENPNLVLLTVPRMICIPSVLCEAIKYWYYTIIRHNTIEHYLTYLLQPRSVCVLLT